MRRLSRRMDDGDFRVMRKRAQEVCGDCQYWEAGECFRFPPHMVPYPTDNPPHMVPYPTDNQHPVLYVPMSLRPATLATSPACGEWKEYRP